MKTGSLAFLIPALVATVFLASALPSMMESPVCTGEPAAMSRDQASIFARLALKGLSKEYPNKLEHVMTGPDDVRGPKALHPAFYGSYDWHSSVHGHWMLARL